MFSVISISFPLACLSHAATWSSSFTNFGCNSRKLSAPSESPWICHSFPRTMWVFVCAIFFNWKLLLLLRVVLKKCNSLPREWWSFISNPDSHLHLNLPAPSSSNLPSFSTTEFFTKKWCLNFLATSFHSASSLPNEQKQAEEKK